MNQDIELIPTRALNISIFTRDVVKYYAVYPEKRDWAIIQLSRVFLKDNDDIWGKVVKSNAFTSTFKEKFGKRNVRLLEELLLEINPERFSQVPFDWDK